MNTLLEKARAGLKTNTEGILVRTKDGKSYREKILNGQIIASKEEGEQHIEFFIEGAPDPHSFEIIPYLYLGAQDAAVNIEELTSLKITHILNVATGITNSFPEVQKLKEVTSN
jgi:hypothetical protein